MSASLDVSAQVPGGPRPRIARLASGDIIQVVAELSDLLDAGCPLSRALGVVLRQAKKPPVQRLVEGLRDDIVNGSSLADALGNAGGHFSPVQVAMVRAAEAGGFLQQTLAHMSTFGRRRLVLIGKMKASLTYPAVLMTTAIASVAFLLTFVVPRFSGVYESAGVELPGPTRLLMAVSDATYRYWWAGVAGILGLAVIVRVLLRNEQVRQRLDRAILAMPLAGRTVHLWAMVEFSRAMALLLEGGITVVSALRLSGQVLGNRALRATVARMTVEVQQGKTIGRLMQDDKLFEASMAELVTIAEESGKLPQVLRRLAEQYQERFETRLDVLISLVEPLIIVAVALVIGLIVAAMLLPVLLMSSLVA